ncbi:hypothetical protein D9M71_683150 [compost metagenome]
MHRLGQRYAVPLTAVVLHQVGVDQALIGTGLADGRQRRVGGAAITVVELAVRLLEERRRYRVMSATGGDHAERAGNVSSD